MSENLKVQIHSFHRFGFPATSLIFPVLDSSSDRWASLHEVSWSFSCTLAKSWCSFCDAHDFVKPNDIRCLRLMNECAAAVMEFFPDILIAYGQSDEYSFAFRPSTQVYKRRASKLVSLAVSCFTARFVMRWSIHFPDTPLRSIPSFDGRAVCYPTNRTLRDYLSWRQADCLCRVARSPGTTRSPPPPFRPHQQPVQHLLLGARAPRRRPQRRGHRAT